MSLGKPKGKIKLFACGGGGVNIGQRFERFRNQTEAGFGEIEITYIDTSLSNMKSAIDPAHCYLFEGMDGSGKVRAENHAEISQRVRDILQKHQPGDLNIVLSTGGGGSGSVIAPSIASELLAKEIPVIAILIGSADTRKDAENTLNTIKSYASVSKKREAPVVAYYVQNSETLPRSKADDKVESLIQALCALYSHENSELDSRDLFNWLRFDRVTTFTPQLAALSLIDSTLDLSDLGNVISVATLATSEETGAFPVIPEYQAVGFLAETVSQRFLKTTPLHFVVSDGVFSDVGSALQSILKDLTAAQQARVRKTSLLGSGDAATDDGLIL